VVGGWGRWRDGGGPQRRRSRARDQSPPVALRRNPPTGTQRVEQAPGQKRRSSAASAPRRMAGRGAAPRWEMPELMDIDFDDEMWRRKAVPFSIGSIFNRIRASLGDAEGGRRGGG